MPELCTHPRCNSSLPVTQRLFSEYAILDESHSRHHRPSQQEIWEQCGKLKAEWDEREKVLRRLRAEMSWKFGTCRNF